MATKTPTRPAEAKQPDETNHADQAAPPIVEDAATILAVNDRQTEVVTVPEWGLRVTLQSLTGNERDDVDAWVQAHRDESGNVKQAGFRTFLISRTAVNSKGELLFTEAQIEALGRKNHLALLRLAEVAARLSKMNETDVDEATDDLGKGQSSASGTS
ncbi:MAG TPA: hypothetical protein VEW95_09415 [Candidatus Limnocylindrales bacterium]|nr:hypothetical protein [Candidatus Limnocylindrales bacterium]